MTVSYGSIGSYSLTPWLLLASLVSKHPHACPAPLSSTFNVEGQGHGQPCSLRWLGCCSNSQALKGALQFLTLSLDLRTSLSVVLLITFPYGEAEREEHRIWGPLPELMFKPLVTSQEGDPFFGNQAITCSEI